MSLDRTEIIKNFRDLLALLALVIIIPGLWVIHGLGIVQFPGEVIGATVMGWGLILEYYLTK